MLALSGRAARDLRPSEPRPAPPPPRPYVERRSAPHGWPTEGAQPSPRRDRPRHPTRQPREGDRMSLPVTPAHGIAIGDLGVPPSIASALAVLYRRRKG